MGMITWLKNVFGIETEEVEASSEGVGAGAGTAASAAIAPATAPAVSLPMDEEEKNLVAVVASCIAGSSKPEAQLHIQRITRVE